MKFITKIALLMIAAAVQFPCVTHAAEEDRDLALIAAEQRRSENDEHINNVNPALTDSLSTTPTQETDKEIRERRKKLKETRREKEKENRRKLKEHTNKNDTRRTETITIDPNEPEPPPPPPPPPPVVEPKPQPVTPPTPPTPQPVSEPEPQPVTPPTPPTPQPVSKPEPQPVTPPPPTPTSTQPIPPPPVETVTATNQKAVYANFVEVARAVRFTPLYMPRKSGYEITALFAGQGIVEVRYGRRWEPTVSLTVRTYRRADGEELRDISGVTGVKWRVDSSTGTTVYIAKISDTQHVAAWAVGHYTFSAQGENMSFAGFHSIIADELVELSTHYYLDL